MINLIILLSLAMDVRSQLDTGEIINCKLTRTGTEYKGVISTTKTNNSCMFWFVARQMVEDADDVTDKTFPDGSMVLAENYCRNPTNDSGGPWCFAEQNDNVVRCKCNVPFCKNKDCRVTGTGMEYAGKIDTTASGRKCSPWTSKHRISKDVVEKSFKSNDFPDDSVRQVGSKCRNPDGSLGGPWCYVKDNKTNFYEREFCDVPFCDDLGTIMYSERSSSGEYFVFSSIQSSQTLDISFRLWNPEDWLTGKIFIFVSGYDIALDRLDIERWKSGFEILVSQNASGVMSDKDEVMCLTKVPNIMSASKWTDLRLYWYYPDYATLVLQVYERTKSEPFAHKQIFRQGTIFQVQNIRFFSLAGSPSLWYIPYDDQECMIHTTSTKEFTRFWLLKRTKTEKFVDISMRATREAVMLIRTTPMAQSKQIQITVGDVNKVKISVYYNAVQAQQYNETVLPRPLDFWKWLTFKITFYKDRMQLFLVRPASTKLLLEFTHPSVAAANWIGFASPTVSYWTIYCNPTESTEPFSLAPPECIYQSTEPYNGTLCVTKSGEQCLPWTDTKLIPPQYQNEELFLPYGGKVFCRNYCRNLDRDPNGPFCIVRDLDSDVPGRKEYCHPRSCVAGDCKVAGTGNDYLGKVNITGSKRLCRRWTDYKNDSLVNVKNFPDPSLEDAGNYCRNPSKSVTGCWCYTNDTRIPRDICLIKDCERPSMLECTILISGFLSGRKMYIMPQWRNNGLHFWVKAWSPDIYDGLVFSMLSADGTEEYLLMMGDQDNEKVKLFYKTESQCFYLEQKTLPHLIPSGRWGGYWLRPGNGKIELGYHGMSTSFFQWTSRNDSFDFEPMYINFGTIQDHWVGFNLPCNECLVEETSVDQENKIYPINLWHEEQYTSSLNLNLRGAGSAVITLMWTPELNRSLAVEIDSIATNINMLQYDHENRYTVLATFSVPDGIIKFKWTEYVIKYNENSLSVEREGNVLLTWNSTFPLLFYWFSVSAARGTITWSANCPPADIDGVPRDGNWGDWGPWSCSVTCGRGEGRLERKCDNPPPNVFGKDCQGSAMYDGVCNDFPCGDITPDTYASIRKYLSSHHQSIEVEAKNRVMLPCNPEAIALISQEVSYPNISWTHNGVKTGKLKYRMDANYNLVIPHATEKHNGVYLCIVHQSPKSIPPKIVLEVVSVIVKRDKPTKKIGRGGYMVMKCNGLALSTVYGDLSLRWELNGSIWRDYGIGAVEAVPIDRIENINDSHAGIWTCIVTQEDFKFKWKTNWIKLRVKSRPNYWTHFKDDILTLPVLNEMCNEKLALALFFGTILITPIGIAVLLFFLYRYLKKVVKTNKTCE